MLGRRTIIMGAGAFAALWAVRPTFAAAPASWPFVLRNGRLFVTAAINGVSTEALLDSGAEVTVIERAAASRFGIAAGKPLKITGSGAARQAAEIVTGIRIEALGLSLTPEAVVTTDLSDVSRRLAGVPLEAILGREIFDAARLRIDFANRTIERLDPQSTPAGVQLPLTTEHGIETVPITIAGRRAQATLDIGNGSRPMISTAFAEANGLLAGRLTGQARGGGIGGEKALTTVRLDGVEIAGRRFDGIEFAVEEGANASDANIGTSLLSAFRITIDYAARFAWLEPV